MLKAIFTRSYLELVGVQAVGPEPVTEIMNYAVAAVRQSPTAYDLAAYQFASPSLWFWTPVTYPLQPAALKVVAERVKAAPFPPLGFGVSPAHISAGPGFLPVLAYTVGYGGLKPEEFLRLVAELGSRVVADVRRFPRSRIEFYSGERLRAELEARGVGYVWLGELGALGLARSHRPAEEVSCTGSPTFRAYVHYLVTEPRALAALAKLRDMAEAGLAPLIICRERKPEHCHRQFVADALTALGVEVVHVVGGRRERHAGTPCYSYIASRLAGLAPSQG